MGGMEGVEDSVGGVGVEEGGRVSTVTAKRICSMALESCCLGCCFWETELFVWKRSSILSAIFMSLSIFYG